MKKLVQSFAVILLLFCYSISYAEHPAPAFKLPTQDGHVSLADYEGKVVYIDFWASWCGPCRQSFPWMESMHQKYKSADLQFLAINLDENREDAEWFLKSQAVNFTVAFDPVGVTPKLYKIPGMPSSFIIGANGEILFSHAGFSLHSTDLYEKHIVEALRSLK